MPNNSFSSPFTAWQMVNSLNIVCTLTSFCVYYRKPSSGAGHWSTRYRRRRGSIITTSITTTTYMHLIHVHNMWSNQQHLLQWDFCNQLAALYHAYQNIQPHWGVTLYIILLRTLPVDATHYSQKITYPPFIHSCCLLFIHGEVTPHFSCR